MVPLLFPLPHVVNWIACLQGAVVPKKFCGVRCYYFCASRSVFTLKISKRSVFTLKISKWTLRPQELCLQYFLFHLETPQHNKVPTLWFLFGVSWNTKWCCLPCFLLLLCFCVLSLYFLFHYENTPTQQGSILFQALEKKTPGPY